MDTTAEPKIILPDSDEAASVQAVTGWVSRTGRFWGDDEHMARWEGSTHRACLSCGEPLIRDGWAKCKACRDKADDESYFAAERSPWDGISLIYSKSTDRYFNDPEEVYEYAEGEETDPDEMRLFLCTPNYAWEIDSSIYEDIIPSDDEGELPDELQKAMDAFNAAVKAYGKPVSWEPSKIVCDLPESPEGVAS